MDKIALRQSIIAAGISGLIFAGFSFGTYYSGIPSFAGFSFIYKFLPVVLVIILILGFQLRKQVGGYIGFKQVLQYALVSYLIYEIVVAIVTYILFIVIDPLLTRKLFDAALQFSVNIMKSAGSPQNKIDETLANAKKQANVTTGIGTIIKGFPWSLLWDFVLSLIAAFIIKKDKPADLDFNPKQAF